jgi:ligand-binding sensor domain-containing protein
LKSFFVIFAFFICIYARTQAFPQIEFQTFTDADGLADIYCNKIVQDKNGIIWVGTRNGISRYDGTRFKTFSSFLRGKEQTRLGHIYNVLPLKNGGMWIGSDEQLFYFNTENEFFYKTGIKAGNVYSEKHKAMIKMPDNYYTLPSELKKDKLKLYPNLKGKNDCNKYYTFIFDKKGQIWSWAGYNLVKIDQKTRKIIKKYSFKSQAGVSLQKIHFDNKNRLWVSTWGNGVFIFNPKTEKLDRVETVFNNDYVALGFINWMHQGKNYIVVLGDASLVLIDEETLDVKMYEDKEGRFRVFDAFQDKQGNLWLATEYGLKFINSKQSFAQVISILNSNEPTNKFQKAVTTIYQDETNFFVAKRWFDGVYIYDKNWKLEQHIPQFETQNTNEINQNSSEILGIMTSGENKYFSGYCGLYKLSKEGIIKKIIPKGFKENEQIYLEEIVVESKKVWWIKYKSGILKFNPLTDEFIDNFSLN